MRPGSRAREIEEALLKGAIEDLDIPFIRVLGFETERWRAGTNQLAVAIDCVGRFWETDKACSVKVGLSNSFVAHEMIGRGRGKG